MKEIILNEKQFKKMLSEGFMLDLAIVKPKMTEKQYPVNLEKVKIIKKFLDNGFTRGQSEDLGETGYPVITSCFGQLDSAGNVLCNLGNEQMLELLMDRFQNLCAEKEETERLLKRVLEDWFNKKIQNDGRLSVNSI